MSETQLLKDRPGHLNLDSGQSDTLIVKGFPRTMTDEEVIKYVSVAATPVEIDLENRFAMGAVWVRFESIDMAFKTRQLVDHVFIAERILGVRFELGKNDNGARIPDPNSHTTIMRKITKVDTNVKYVKKKPVSHDKNEGICYTCNALISRGYRYPFPSGLYTSRLVFLCDQELSDAYNGAKERDLLLAQLTRRSKGHAKEISEAMAMADAVQRAMKCTLGVAPARFSKSVNVYLVGDGKHALGTSAAALHLPDSWKLFSIDPILEPIDLGSKYQNRVELHSCMSQDFPIETFTETYLHIVVACHSHAPLQELWDRTRSPKICVSMACCANYSDLTDKPVLEFLDYEVYSPKRLVKIFYSE